MLAFRRMESGSEATCAAERKRAFFSTKLDALGRASGAGESGMMLGMGTCKV
jgi:hypothetical protein